MISDNFVPARLHVREQAEAYKRLSERYRAEWTPTILILDASGTERHRIEGFLPTEDFLSHLEFGLGRVAFSRGGFEDAEARFRDVVQRHPESDAAPESLYWAGVARYKATNDADALADTARAFTDRYQDTPWAKKASVWAP